MQYVVFAEITKHWTGTIIAYTSVNECSEQDCLYNAAALHYIESCTKTKLHCWLGDLFRYLQQKWCGTWRCGLHICSLLYATIIDIHNGSTTCSVCMCMRARMCESRVGMEGKMTGMRGRGVLERKEKRNRGGSTVERRWENEGIFAMALIIHTRPSYMRIIFCVQI